MLLRATLCVHDVLCSPEQWWTWYRRLEKSELMDVFVGQLRSTLTCSTCGHCSVTFDPFWELSVSLPSNRVSPPPFSLIIIQEREASMGQQRHSFLCAVSSKCVNPLPFPKALKLKQMLKPAPPAESAHSFSGKMCVLSQVSFESCVAHTTPNS